MHARRQRLPLFLLVGLIVSAVFAAFPETATADPAGTMVEFPVPTPSANPLVTTSGPDANVWFTEQGGNKIARITANGTITEFDVPTASSSPLGITAAPDGNIWFTENGGNQIAKFDVGTHAFTEFSAGITPSAGLTLINKGPDGNLWFCEQGANNVGRITPTGTITEFALPTPNSFPSGIIAGPDGNLWFTEAGANAIGRITTAGVISEFPTPTPSSRPIEIKVGLDGNLWFAENSQAANSIGRITTAGVISEFPIPTPRAQPAGIANGLDGNVWFAESGDSSDGSARANNIGRVAPDGTITEFPVPTVAANMGGISPGPDGRLWFAEQDGNKIGRVSTGAPWTVDIADAATAAQATVVQTPFGDPLKVFVRDPDGTPLVGATVTFTAPSNGASGTFAGGSTTATALTDGSGVATAPTLTANTTTGNFSVNGHVNFANLDANFALTNQPAPAPTTTTTTTATTATTAVASAPAAPSSGSSVGSKATSGASVRGRLPATGAYAFASTSSLAGAFIAFGFALSVIGRARRTRRRRLRFQG